MTSRQFTVFGNTSFSTLIEGGSELFTAEAKKNAAAEMQSDHLTSQAVYYRFFFSIQKCGI